ncbi:MAG: AAA family ATPase [Opitutales bacterium]
MNKIDENSPDLESLFREFPELWNRIHEEMGKRVVGQKAVVSQILVTLFAQGHCLLVGVPGLAKTHIIKTLSEILSVDFKRIQFTPDLMPSDVTGLEILQQDAEGRREFKFVEGPIFTQLLLADEINRTPPKTQAALLEAMAERTATVGGAKHPLPEPFFVLATQNPLEQEGTYRLPEAELDRFLLCLNMEYPELEEEISITEMTTTNSMQPVDKVLDAETLVNMQIMVRTIPIPKSVSEYLVRVVRLSRPQSPDAPEGTKRYVRWGAGTRACQALALCGKVYAAVAGRANVAIDDVDKAVHAVLNHRMILNYHASSDGKTVDALIDEIIASAKKA